MENWKARGPKRSTLTKQPPVRKIELKPSSKKGSRDSLQTTPGKNEQFRSELSQSPGGVPQIILTTQPDDRVVLFRASDLQTQPEDGSEEYIDIERSNFKQPESLIKSPTTRMGASRLSYNPVLPDHQNDLQKIEEALYQQFGQRMGRNSSDHSREDSSGNWRNQSPSRPIQQSHLLKQISNFSQSSSSRSKHRRSNEASEVSGAVKNSHSESLMSIPEEHPTLFSSSTSGVDLDSQQIALSHQVQPMKRQNQPLFETILDIKAQDSRPKPIVLDIQKQTPTGFSQPREFASGSQAPEAHYSSLVQYPNLPKSQPIDLKQAREPRNFQNTYVEPQISQFQAEKPIQHSRLSRQNSDNNLEQVHRVQEMQAVSEDFSNMAVGEPRLRDDFEEKKEILQYFYRNGNEVIYEETNENLGLSTLHSQRDVASPLNLSAHLTKQQRDEFHRFSKGEGSKLFKMKMEPAQQKIKYKPGSLLFTVPTSLKNITATKKASKPTPGLKQRPKMAKPKPVATTSNQLPAPNSSSSNLIKANSKSSIKSGLRQTSNSSSTISQRSQSSKKSFISDGSMKSKKGSIKSGSFKGALQGYSSKGSRNPDRAQAETVNQIYFSAKKSLVAGSFAQPDSTSVKMKTSKSGVGIVSEFDKPTSSKASFKSGRSSGLGSNGSRGSSGVRVAKKKKLSTVPRSKVVSGGGRLFDQV